MFWSSGREAELCASVAGVMNQKDKNERCTLEIKILKYRSLARRVVYDKTRKRIYSQIAELEQKLREIDEKGRR
jgi:hypothetical protein